MKKIITMHICAFLLTLPMIMAFSQGIVANIIGLLYLVWLWIAANETETGRKFCRDYYKEILRIERMMS